MKKHVEQLLKRPSNPQEMAGAARICDEALGPRGPSWMYCRKIPAGADAAAVMQEMERPFPDIGPDPCCEAPESDMRGFSLAEKPRHKRVSTVDIGLLDTVVIPVQEDKQSLELLFGRGCWNPVQLEPGRIAGMQYAAFYFPYPSCSITHYAKIKRVTPCTDDPRKHVLHFELPEELGQPLEWSRVDGSLRRPRYTVFSLLLEARAIEELFGAV